MKKDLKLSQAIFWILASTFVISGFSYFTFFQYKKMQKKRCLMSSYNIKTISQSVNDNNLDVNYLAEIMNLSLDRPTNLFVFDEMDAKEKLLKNPLIKTAEIKKIKPNCVFVDYEIRKPIALLYDFDNFAIDEDGNIFPYEPFFKDNDLSKIYLGLESLEKLKKVESKEACLALDMLKKLQESGFSKLVKIVSLDTSRSQLQSYGQREILLEIEEDLIVKQKEKEIHLIFPKILRLMENNYLQQIGNYISLREKIMRDYESQFKQIRIDDSEIKFKPKTIDLRISKLAFIDQ
ncbi:MAG: FtsQ-type POTRA domain-containing protein [Parachlamydiales bacterium]|jgi:hypothetical protein